jgi:predicted nucleotidyltransferase
VQAITPDATLILYGSRARGTASLDSDYDLLILVEQLTQQLEDQLGDQLYTLELEYGVILSTLVYERHVWDSPLSKAMPLHQSIEQEGVLV